MTRARTIRFLRAKARIYDLVPIMTLLLIAVMVLFANAGRRRPGVVLFLVVDTLRADHLGCYGYDAIETPNLDRLAREGTLYEAAITTAPVTLPAVASLMTGAYPVQHGIRDNGAFRLGDPWPTLAERFRDGGYLTAAFVSASLLSSDHGLDQGFGTYDAEMSKSAESYDPLLRQVPEEGEAAERRADETIDRALAWAGAHPGKDLFLFVHLFDPHLPRDPPPEYRNRYPGRPYDGEIAFVDAQVGRLMKGLLRGRRPADLFTIVTADHGEGLQDHGEELHGFLLFDEVMRVPLILHGRGVPQGARVRTQVRSVDLAATACAIARLHGLPESAGAPLPGIEYQELDGAGGNDAAVPGAPAVPGKEPRPAYLETFRPRLSYGWCELRGIRTERWKLVRGPEDELYDMRSDPKERMNVRARYPEVCDSLGRAMDRIALDAVALGRHDATLGSLTPRERDHLESLGYLAGPAPTAASAARPMARTAADSLAVWHFPVAERGASLGLPHPATRLAAYNRRVIANSFCLAASGAWRQSDLALAKRHYASAIEAEATHAPAYEGLARVCEAMADTAGARAALRRGLEAGAKSEILYGRLAELERLAGDLDAAEAAIVEGTRAYPRSAWCWSVRALVHMDQGRFSQAASSAEMAIEVDPDFARAHFMRGLIARETHDSARARKEWTRYLELEPQSPDRARIRAYLDKT